MDDDLDPRCGAHAACDVDCLDELMYHGLTPEDINHPIHPSAWGYGEVGGESWHNFE